VLRHHEAHARDLDRPALRREVQAARNLGYLSAGPQSSDNAASLAIPIRFADGNAIASIVLSGSPVVGAESVLPASWREICDQMSTLLRDGGTEMTSPFAHLDPDDIVLKVPPAGR